MNCYLCEADLAAMGLPSGPMFYSMCALGAILLQLQREGQLSRIMATIRARRKEAKSHD